MGWVQMHSDLTHITACPWQLVANAIPMSPPKGHQVLCSVLILTIICASGSQTVGSQNYNSGWSEAEWKWHIGSALLTMRGHVWEDCPVKLKQINLHQMSQPPKQKLNTMTKHMPASASPQWVMKRDHSVLCLKIFTSECMKLKWDCHFVHYLHF